MRSKLRWALAAGAAAGLALAGCSQVHGGLDGTYNFSSMTVDGRTYTLAELQQVDAGQDYAQWVLEFQDKGATVTFTLPGEEASTSSYTLDGTKLTFDDPEGLTLNGTLGENSVTVSIPGEAIGENTPSMDLVFTKAEASGSPAGS
jgi:hypothetical protein